MDYVYLIVPAFQPGLKNQSGHCLDWRAKSSLMLRTGAGTQGQSESYPVIHMYACLFNRLYVR